MFVKRLKTPVTLLGELGKGRGMSERMRREEPRLLSAAGLGPGLHVVLGRFDAILEPCHDDVETKTLPETLRRLTHIRRIRHGLKEF